MFQKIKELAKKFCLTQLFSAPAFILAEAAVLILLLLFLLPPSFLSSVLVPVSMENKLYAKSTSSEAEKYIKWVDFNVTAEAMQTAFRYDVNSIQEDIHVNWVDLLSYLGAKYGGDFSLYKSKDMELLVQRLKDGETIESLTKDMKYYNYYREAYGAVLDNLVGTHKIQVPSSQEQEDPVWVTKYGLKGFSPIAKSFPYSDFDDFGTARSYGFKRQHLGHDMMGQVGTPVIAVESGYVEALGWNQYGGWRIGIRSFDKKRYYYYAHLRKNYPYQSNLKEGSIVQAGDVIGYLGRTGYSTKENTNNIEQPHLHFGIQLIFNESQKEGNNEIWINCYELVKFLSLNRCQVYKVEGTKEWKRVYEIEDPSRAAY